ncbi:MAG TPA: hotdog domain-containing protein [Polaromonas sp.]
MTSQALETRWVEMIFPDQTNHYGTLFGGNALNLLSKAAFLAASRHARGDVVMAACSRVKFLAPVRLGQSLALTARITRSGRSSMTVRVEGEAQTLATGQSLPVLEGDFEMVAVDAQGCATECKHFKEIA